MSAWQSDFTAMRKEKGQKATCLPSSGRTKHSRSRENDTSHLSLSQLEKDEKHRPGVQTLFWQWLFSLFDFTSRKTWLSSSHSLLLLSRVGFEKSTTRLSDPIFERDDGSHIGHQLNNNTPLFFSPSLELSLTKRIFLSLLILLFFLLRFHRSSVTSLCHRLRENESFWFSLTHCWNDNWTVNNWWKVPSLFSNQGVYPFSLLSRRLFIPVCPSVKVSQVCDFFVLSLHALFSSFPFPLYAVKLDENLSSLLSPSHWKEGRFPSPLVFFTTPRCHTWLFRVREETACLSKLAVLLLCSWLWTVLSLVFCKRNLSPSLSPFVVSTALFDDNTWTLFALSCFFAPFCHTSLSPFLLSVTLPC